MDQQAVNKFKEKQREAMKKLKSDYASKLKNLKQAKKELQQEDNNKENFPINAISESRNVNFQKFGEGQRVRI